MKLENPWVVNPMGAAFSTAAWPILWAPVVFPSRATAFVREIFHGPAATQTMLIKTRAWRLCLVYVYACNRLYIYIGMNNFKSLSQNVVSPKVPGLPSFFPLRLIEIGKF